MILNAQQAREYNRGCELQIFLVGNATDYAGYPPFNNDVQSFLGNVAS